MIISKLNRFLGLAVLCGFLIAAMTSCKVGPDYQRPTVQVPTTFKSAAAIENQQPRLARLWWQLFGDPELNRLEQAAISASPTLQAAAARVLQARAAARIVESRFYPLISADPGFTRSRASANRSGSSVVNGSGSSSTGTGATGTGTGTGTGGTTTTIPIGGSSSKLVTTSVQIPFDLTYEVDIWGRVRRLAESSEDTARASEIDYEVVMQTLEADVATGYFNIRSLDAQDAILVKNVASYQKQIDLTQKQLKAGIVGQIDLLQAQALLYSTSAQEIEISRQRIDAEHALAILVGLPPAEFAVDVKPLALQPPGVPAGLPGDLLRRRPDVAESEVQLMSQNAQIGVAIAEFYPKLTLTGAAGFESLGFKHSLDWASRFWSIGPSLSIPIFNGGELKANLDQIRARYGELLANYRNSVLGAYRDVEDSLTDLHRRADGAAALDAAVSASREYLRLSEVQYQRGLTAYLTVIDAERTLLTNELSAAQLLNQRLASTILLIKALGGGWDPDLPPALISTTQPAPKGPWLTSFQGSTTQPATQPAR